MEAPASAVTSPRLVLVLSENWTMTPERDLRALVRIAQDAEEAGIDGVMLSEHIVLGPSAGAKGRPANPRDYAAPGGPGSGHPVARLDRPDERHRRRHHPPAGDRRRHHRAAAPPAAARPPAGHPRPARRGPARGPADGQLAPRGYAHALGIPFEQRGELLDEHLAAWSELWAASPASFGGRRYSFHDVYLEPKPFRPDGPRLWFGGSSVGPWIVRRLVAHGHGFHPFGQPTAAQMQPLVDAMAAAGLDRAELEIVGGSRGELAPGDGVADLAGAVAAIPAQLEAGYTTICFKPSQFTDDPAEVGDLCRRLVKLSAR